MRRLIFALILLAAIIFIISNFGSFQNFAAVLQMGNPVWIGLAFIVQGTWLLNVSAQYRTALRTVGIERNMRDLFVLMLGSNFLNVVAPSGGVSGMALFLDDARRRGISTARVTIAGVIHVMFDYIAFCCVLALGLLVLIRRNTLSPIELVPSAIMFGTAIGLSAVVVLGMRSADALERLLVTAARAVNWAVRPVIRRGYLSEAAAQRFALDTAEGFRTLRHQPRGGWIFPFALALSSKALLITLLFLVFLVFDQPFSVGTLTAGFSIGFLFQIVSPTPMGIGVVEGAMTIVLRTLRVPLEAAVIITIVFRGFTLWLPLLYGAIALHFSGLRRK
ncbi:MAG TPA: lysylphosphatidylglycerol synthase transmembrane domain-containing protein [Anaerolineales bacterium]|nr:lysylphosphatidylglycerol synthase transmembrane domain-containing protein [Anaerolineales bacterium]